jgi:hypothetical protein
MCSGTGPTGTSSPHALVCGLPVTPWPTPTRQADLRGDLLVRRPSAEATLADAVHCGTCMKPFRIRFGPMSIGSKSGA